MNLKEAFQMQKALSRLMEEAASYLDDTDNIMTVTEKHLRSKVVPEQADESVDCSEKSRMAYNPMTVLRAWHALMEEKERLGRAITAAKAAMPLNFDTAAEENKARRRFLQTLAHMAEQRSTSKRKRGAGKGYVFEGFVYRPNEDKLHLIRMMESSLYSFRPSAVKAFDPGIILKARYTKGF